MHSATQILALKERKVGFIKMFNHKPLLVSDDRSLLSCCTVLVYLLSIYKNTLRKYYIYNDIYIEFIFRYAKEFGCTWTPGMSMTNGSEGSLGKETPPSAVTAVTRNRYKIPDTLTNSSDVFTNLFHELFPRIFHSLSS